MRATNLLVRRCQRDRSRLANSLRKYHGQIRGPIGPLKDTQGARTTLSGPPSNLHHPHQMSIPILSTRQNHRSSNFFLQPYGERNENEPLWVLALQFVSTSSFLPATFVGRLIGS